MTWLVKAFGLSWDKGRIRPMTPKDGRTVDGSSELPR